MYDALKVKGLDTFSLVSNVIQSRKMESETGHVVTKLYSDTRSLYPESGWNTTINQLPSQRCDPPPLPQSTVLTGVFSSKDICFYFVIIATSWKANYYFLGSRLCIQPVSVGSERLNWRVKDEVLTTLFTQVKVKKCGLGYDLVKSWHYYYQF